MDEPITKQMVDEQYEPKPVYIGGMLIELKAYASHGEVILVDTGRIAYVVSRGDHSIVNIDNGSAAGANVEVEESVSEVRTMLESS